MDWPLVLLFVIEALAIVLANLGTIIIFSTTPRLHRHQYVMIISQAVADLLVGLIVVPMFIIYDFGENERTFRRTFNKIELTLGFTSIMGLAGLAIERAHATYYPFRHATLGNGSYAVGVTVSWLLPLAVTIVRYLTGRRMSYIIKIVFIFTILSFICMAYTLVILKVRCTNPQSNGTHHHDNKKLTTTLAIVTLFSVAMWLPYQIMLINGYKISVPIKYMARFLMYGNSLVNSVIYAFRMREIKREILRVFACCRKENQISTEVVRTTTATRRSESASRIP